MQKWIGYVLETTAVEPAYWRLLPSFVDQDVEVTLLTEAIGRA